MCHPATIAIEKLITDCRIEHTRRSGPGGQHRNKVQTAIVIEHLPTQIRGEACERRSQLQNRSQAIHRLRINLALTHRSSDNNEIPEIWHKRTKGNQISVNSEHQDFPSLLAIALDMISVYEYSISTAAKKLKITTSQLTRFLKIDKQAFTMVNQERQARNMSVIR